jgi:hypothetical protein
MIASAAYARMQEAGLKFRGEPITFEEGDGLKAGIGTKVAYCGDPDVHAPGIDPTSRACSTTAALGNRPEQQASGP